MEPTSEQIASFTTDLRHAITMLGEALPDAEDYLRRHVDERYARFAHAFRLSACPLMEEFLQIASLLEPGAPSWPDTRARSAMSRGRTFVDDWLLPYEAPLTVKLFRVDQCFLDLTAPPPLPPDGQVLDDHARSAIARYRTWRPTYDRARQAEESALRTAREAAAPLHRALPHQPDPPSLLMARTHAEGAIRQAAMTNAAHRSPEETASLASSHLTRGLVGHWLKKFITEVRADLECAADLMATALPDIPLHAWLYEQWQHLAIALGHSKLTSALWNLRREDWDHDRIRPVDWLVCRIRMLDLLHRSGTDTELRELLEKCRLGLFVEKLPAELELDLPLMRCWYHLLRAIILRDNTIFNQRLAERHELLAAYWKRGGGVAPLSVIDLGGLALLRTAKARGLQPTPVDLPYLPADFV